ncbi:putative glutathione-dependent formaldehyde-activating enzyme [Colletotrichum shisoi]|uniref:Putative glutathione-dependent formaldehyde-activating enzyme n=1 Tax=Colletotrichum shisoi TaxID=2078593 RepID=A0A5Q4BKG0_9PEZI|nr:putative glutathione-dependent formaldehyde-activating enzyme [Colletotrichum shisoi]
MAPYQGHCNCGSIKVTLSTKPESIIVCHCANCKRAGGPFSMNFLVGDGQWKVEDGQNTLTEYLDNNTDSGNPVHRFFCRNCGSPVKTTAKPFPGQALVKASLFDDIPTKRSEVFGQKALSWA